MDNGYPVQENYPFMLLHFLEPKFPLDIGANFEPPLPQLFEIADLQYTTSESDHTKDTTIRTSLNTCALHRVHHTP
jgi:hypothetical protein